MVVRLLFLIKNDNNFCSDCFLNKPFVQIAAIKKIARGEFFFTHPFKKKSEFFRALQPFLIFIVFQKFKKMRKR